MSEGRARPGLPAFLPRVAPFALFMALVAAQPLAEGLVDTRWVVALRGLAVGALLLAFWPRYVELRSEPRPSLLDAAVALALGAAVFLAWITFDRGWAAFGEARIGFTPVRRDGSLDALLLSLRVLGFVVVVPIMEELFWRSFVMRRVSSADFLAVDPARAGLAAFALSSALFALEHSQWFAGLLAGAAFGWAYMRSRTLSIAILSHATTNALLALWIIQTRQWHYW